MSHFHDLHRPGEPFVLVNVWDRGTARLAAGTGARAVATSSAALAFTLGRPDGGATLEDTLAHAEALAGAAGIPLAIDFEDGFAEAPSDVARNVARAAETGAAGVSVEDWRRDGSGAYGGAEAVERVAAAVEAARAAGLHLTARADGVLRRAYDVAEAVRRLSAFAEAGADCLYAPMLPDEGAMAEVVAIGPPVNALAAGPWLDWDLSRWAGAGVARVSLGSTLASLVQRAALDGARAAAEGRLPALAHATPAREIAPMLEAR
jgi:2-methylisocitrate lyase-like PEP mutase family enzyme